MSICGPLIDGRMEQGDGEQDLFVSRVHVVELDDKK